MSVSPRAPLTLEAVGLEPLRIVPTLAAIVLAVALGSLIMGTCSVGLQRVDGLGGAMSVFAALALWVFAAACVYAANRQWLGRRHDQRLNRFFLCMAIAVPVVPVIVVFGVNVHLALGGHM